MSEMQMKLCADGLDVEYELLQPVTDERQLRIYNQINEIDGMMEENRLKIEEINRELERLTNHADGLDYTVAVASGIIAGLIDSFFVGEFDMDWGKETVEKFVKDNAQKQKTEDKIKKAIENAKKKAQENGEELSQEKIDEIKSKITQSVKDQFDSSKQDENEILKKAIKFFEDKYKLLGDDVHQTAGRGISPSSHHLDDLAHHPSLLGLLCAIIMQFTKKGIYQNKDGITKIYPTEDGFVGTDFPSKIIAGTINWFWHLVSDVAGSSKTAGAGMGIPGPILALAKEFAMLPGINKTPLPKLLGEIFEKGFDFRMELTLFHELGRQAIPVIINEAVVRAFYFIRRLYAEFKEKEIKSFKELKLIEWKNVVPAKNRTITRMLTISTGTFVACDMADAAIRSGGTAAGFLLRVNFVGVGRFVVAVGVDAKMGIEKSKNRNERIALCSRQLHLLNAKVAYKQADMWIAAEDTGKAIDELMSIAENSMAFCADSIDEIEENLNKIDSYMDSIREHNPELIDEISDVLKWG
ncbi:MAG: hypothetical protein IJD49_00500 [Clostridia bacterium]|nr:hypothetical protein [Clostridia bacterium]